MQGTYECVKVIGTFHRYGVQQSVDSNGTFYYRPVVYMKDCKDLNNIDLKMPEYLLFNLTKGFKSLGILTPGIKLKINCRRYLKEERNAGYGYPTNIVIANDRPDFPDDPNVLAGMIMVKNQGNPEAEKDPINTDLIQIYKNWLANKE